ncbi:MAG: arsenite efflux rane protein ArsB [Frankiales bacterium]|nr:arsenite efflux rane protein ArsB [Frankiales bacterium]
MWLAAAVLGALTVATGLLSPSGAGDVLDRTGPVLLFLVAITVLAELADEAGVFDVAAAGAARLARGRTLALFGLVVLLASATTILLSLDTTAVLVTPVVLALARQLDLEPMPFALATVWLANTASLLLPVSNLTNLLALSRLGLSSTDYVSRLAVPAVVAIAVTVGLLLLWQRRALSGRYDGAPAAPVEDRVLFAGTAGACVLLAPALTVTTPAVAAGIAAAVAAAFFLWRKRSALRPGLVPWRLVLLVTGLFLVVGAAGPLGVDDLLRQGVGGPLRTAFVSAAGANVVNNLPAYLAVERVVPHDQLLPVLLGVNLGPLVTPWASLATLLWAERCRARGVRISWIRYAAGGFVLVPLLLLATTPLA